ncbi:sulfatase [Haloferula sp.]|uniref:sulfatase n=1 Tax=Haloferula sp. TaxID=2497595 RepID=UPI003C745BA5
MTARWEAPYFACWFLLSALVTAAAPGAPKPNVLLIIVDDLRTELNCYGDSQAITPHIDRLSSEGVTFLNAYAQKAICVPSRQSFLTGIRPDTFGAGFETRFRKKLPDVVTLPQQFLKNGYHTRAIGKVFHHRDDVSWDEPQWVPEPELCYPIYGTKRNLGLQEKKIRQSRFTAKGPDWWAAGGKWIPEAIWEDPDVDDDFLLDGKLANRAVETLRELKDEPFFLAVGFFRPHLPFVAPKRYYDLYPIKDVSLPSDPELPVGAPSFAAETGGEWRGYHEVARVPQMPDLEAQREYIRGYLASVSYVDAQVGRVISALEELGLEKNTIVVLMSDHGYHLFDKNSFGKGTNYEGATRVPFIVRAPGKNPPTGKTHALIELLDLYPSLCDMTGLPIPGHTQGSSFGAVLDDLSLPGKDAAYSQFSRGGYQGYSVRTERYRLTRWIKGASEILELYDYQSDPGETKNLSADPTKESIIRELRALLDRKK